ISHPNPRLLGYSTQVSPIFYNDKFYPASLANVLIGSDQNGSNPEIDITFNSNFNWYIGIDGNTPADKYDLVTTALHEIGHGLGWDGTITCNEIQPNVWEGEWGRQYN